MAKKAMTLLADDHRLASDIKLAARAIRKRWPITETAKKTLVKRLNEIVTKKSVEVMTREGPVAMELPADTNAISAGRVLAMMESQNQSDEHHAEGETLSVNHSGAIVQAPIQQAMNEPEYLEFLRTKRLEGDSNAGPVRVDDQSGEVEASRPPGET